MHEHDRGLVTTKFIYKFTQFHLKLYMYNDYFDVANSFIHGGTQGFS